MHLSIVTGASRGLGLAITEQLLAQGHQVLALSRHPPSGPAASARNLTVWSADLADPMAVAQRLHDWLHAQAATPPLSVSLINNAGVVPAPGPLQATPDAELSRALRVNLEAPLLLSSAFLRATANWKMPRKLLLVSSGLGRWAMAGSALYCASKAGMDHLARSLALEQAALPNGAQVVSLAPGIIDTDMQLQLRGADPTHFPEQARFAAMKDEGRLDSPAQAATRLLRYLARPDFGSNPVADVRDA